MAQKNKFKNVYRGIESPGSVGFAVTPNNTNLLQGVTRSIWVGGAGNVQVDMVDPDINGNYTILISGIAAGTFLPLSVTRIHSTNTTATLIVGFY